MREQRGTGGGLQNAPLNRSFLLFALTLRTAALTGPSERQHSHSYITKMLNNIGG